MTRQGRRPFGSIKPGAEEQGHRREKDRCAAHAAKVMESDVVSMATGFGFRFTSGATDFVFVSFEWGISCNSFFAGYMQAIGFSRVGFK